jgi:stearoyl-CoA desaturase (delta-9 desaturase)
MLWIPITAAGIINGIGHYWGYRNFACADASTNIVPWGILIGGEELHNNHHAYGTSAKLSAQWYEFDLGWPHTKTECWASPRCARSPRHFGSRQSPSQRRISRRCRR